jgi:preprotein translocase subunit SecA
MREVEKSLLLQVLDQVWKEHLLGLDHLRHGIGLRAYGQKDPLNEYKGEAFEMFNAMLSDLDERVTLLLAHMELQIGNLDSGQLRPTSHTTRVHETFEDPAFADDSVRDAQRTQPRRTYGDASSAAGAAATAVIDKDDPATWGKVGRNQPCPCGSGRKFKHCHGVNR